MLKPRIRYLKFDQSGFSLVDVTLAALILSIAVILMMMTMTKGSMSASSETSSMQGLCRAQAQNVLEAIKTYGVGMGHVRYNPASGDVECRSGTESDCPHPDYLSRELLWRGARGGREMRPVDYNVGTGRYQYRPYLLQLSYMNNLIALYHSRGPAICTQGVAIGNLTDLTTGHALDGDKAQSHFAEAHQRTLLRIEPARFSGRPFLGGGACPQELYARPPAPASLPSANMQMALQSVLGASPAEIDLANGRIQDSYDDVELKVTVTTYYRDPFEADENGNAPERSCVVQQSFSYAQQRPVISPTVDPASRIDIRTQCTEPLRQEDRTITVSLSKPGTLLLCRDRTSLIPPDLSGNPICTVSGCPKINFPSTASIPAFDTGTWTPCGSIAPACVDSVSTQIPESEFSGGTQNVEMNFIDVARGCQVLVDVLEVDGSLSFSAGDPSVAPYELTTEDLKTIHIEGQQQDRGLHVCNDADFNGDQCFPEEYICVPEGGNGLAMCEAQFTCDGVDNNQCCCEKTGGVWAGGTCCRSPADSPTCCRAFGGEWENGRCRRVTETPVEEEDCVDGDTRESYSCSGMNWQAVQEVCREGEWTVERYPRGAQCDREGQCSAGQTPTCSADENGCGCADPGGPGGGPGGPTP